MIDKNFYLENLTAFDTLINVDKIEAEKAIFKVYCIMQRDKYWLHNVATPEEFGDEDAELLEEVETELNELEEQYGFRFEYFHQLVMDEMKKVGGQAETQIEVEAEDVDEEEFEDDEFDEEDEFDDEFEEDDDESENDDSSRMGDFSDEELNLVVDYILNSAKEAFHYEAFLDSFPDVTPEFLDDHVLLYIIARKAYGEPDEDIAVTLAESFEINGFEAESEDLLKLTETLGKDLSKEILAFGIAMDSLQHGMHPVDVVAHISDLV